MGTFPPSAPLTLQNLVPFKKKKKATRSRGRQQERMTLAEAFELGDSDDLERVVQAVALLLDWSVESDLKENKLLMVNQGLSNLLFGVAADVARGKIHRARGEES